MKQVPYVAGLIMMVAGIFMIFSLVDIRFTENFWLLISSVGWVLLLGGECILGIDIIYYGYNKSLQQNSLKVKQ